MEEPSISQGEKEGQTEVYLVFGITLLGVGRWQGVPGRLVASVEQDAAAQRGCWRGATEDAGVQGGL